MTETSKNGNRILHIGIVDKRWLKAGRDRISGCLRYAANRPNWQVQILPEDAPPSPDFDGLIGFAQRIVKHGRRTSPRVVLDSKGCPGDCLGISARVQIDDAAIGRKAAEMFLAGGLRNLAFVGTNRPLDKPYESRRLAAFRSAAEEAGAFCDAFLPAEDKDCDLMLLAEWLARLPIPCGIMAFSDDFAKAVLDACRIAHLTVPDQIQLIGVDNEIAICENMQPTLTSILPDFEEGGYMAAKILDGILSRRLRPHKMIEREYGIKSVVVRGSTQDLRGGGRLVTFGREFMRLNANKQITVPDVAANLNVSRRALENRFREILGRGIADVLREERLDRVCRMLRETDRTIDSIVGDSGFASPSHLKSLFKKTYGKTMSEWRRGR